MGHATLLPRRSSGPDPYHRDNIASVGTLPSVIGPYRVIRQLGEGGMGAVFEAVHEVIQRRVAIKVLHAEAGRSADTINRFMNEARAANIVDHPGIVQITDFGHLSDGAGYLVMEYLQGVTLSARMEASGGKIPPSDVVQIGIQIAAAVAAAHKKGIIHRDLKPSNTMLVPDSAMPTGERVKILDFGLAKLSEVREAAAVKTHSQAVMGTPLYMSPEQCEGAGRVDAKSDVYSLGCMLYQMLAGRPPFMGDGPGQIIGQHLFMQPERLDKLAPSVPPSLTKLVHRLLVKPKDERPSMREARQELEELATQLPPPRRLQEDESAKAIDLSKRDLISGGASTLGQGAAESAQHAKRRRRARVLVAGALVLGGAVASVQLLPARSVAPPSSPSAPLAEARPSPVVDAAALSTPSTPAERTIRWTIATTPPGAVVLDSQGGPMGETPWTQERPSGAGTQQIRLRKPGYAEKMLILNQDVDQQVNEKLELLRPAAPRRPQVAPPVTPKNSSPSQPKKDLYID